MGFLVGFRSIVDAQWGVAGCAFPLISRDPYESTSVVSFYFVFVSETGSLNVAQVGFKLEIPLAQLLPGVARIIDSHGLALLGFFFFFLSSLWPIKTSLAMGVFCIGRKHADGTF